MDFYEFKKNIENRLFALEQRDLALFGKKDLYAQDIIVKIDDVLLKQQSLYEEAIELLPDADKLLTFAERVLKAKQLEIYEEIIKDPAINKSNRLKIMDLKSQEYVVYVEDAKLLKNKINMIIEKEKERLWTLRAIKKTFS